MLMLNDTWRHHHSLFYLGISQTFYRQGKKEGHLICYWCIHCTKRLEQEREEREKEPPPDFPEVDLDLPTAQKENSEELILQAGNEFVSNLTIIYNSSNLLT